MIIRSFRHVVKGGREPAASVELVISVVIHSC